MYIHRSTLEYDSYPVISIFFLKFLVDTYVLFWGPLVPCFGFLVTSPVISIETQLKW